MVVWGSAIFSLIGFSVMLFTLAKFRDGEINEEPGELQFSNMKYIPGEGYVDTNVVKMGKTKTLKRVSSSGFISWEAFYDPKTPEDFKNRRPGAMAILAMYGIFAIMAVAMKFLDLMIGIYLIGGLLILLSVLVLIKYVQFGLK